MQSYSKFSKFYDRVMGDRSDAANYIRDLIEHHQPRAKTLLEIACGTGGLLGRLSESYDVTGLDRSRAMLAIAKKRLPHLQLLHQDMTSFRVGRRFDAIVCAFDSINHLLRFADWRRVFRRVKAHLNDGGVFIFDVNTSGKLQRIVDGPPWVGQFGRDTVVITVTKRRPGVFDWNVKIFEHQQQDRYRRHSETITELAVPRKRITASLKIVFNNVKALDPEGTHPSDRSQRLYFVCRGARSLKS